MAGGGSRGQASPETSEQAGHLQRLAHRYASLESCAPAGRRAPQSPRRLLRAASQSRGFHPAVVHIARTRTAYAVTCEPKVLVVAKIVSMAALHAQAWLRPSAWTCVLALRKANGSVLTTDLDASSACQAPLSGIHTEDRGGETKASYADVCCHRLCVRMACTRLGLLGRKHLHALAGHAALRHSEHARSSARLPGCREAHTDKRGTDSGMPGRWCVCFAF